MAVRTSEEIGRGLAPARVARAIPPGERIHILGAAGAGASAAALLAHHAGGTVTACDPGAPSPYTAALEQAGLEVAPRHDASHVGAGGALAVDRLGVTKALTSIDPDNPELLAAREAGLAVEAWQQVIADAARTHGGRLVGVAGTHGKSTTTGWLIHVLAAAGRDPAAFLGALLRAPGDVGPAATGRWGAGDVFLVEADEYAGNFDAYRPALAVLLNAEWDHPDVFEDEEAVLRVFEHWIRGMDGGEEPPVLVANAGDPGVTRVLERLTDWPGALVLFAVVGATASRLESYARGLRDTFRTALGAPQVVVARTATPASSSSGGGTGGARRGGGGGKATVLEIHGLEEGKLVRAPLRLPGWHNAVDGLAVAAAAWRLRVPTRDIVRGLGSFTGVGRRLELKGEVAGVAVLDDYAHHPTAIGASIAAMRQRFPGRRVWAVYEPLTFNRTAALLDAFADVLSGADEVAIADIWAGRDTDTTITSPGALASAVEARGETPAVAPGSVEETADHLAGVVQPGDVVLVMGGGRSYVIASRLLETLTARSGGGQRAAR